MRTSWLFAPLAAAPVGLAVHRARAKRALRRAECVCAVGVERWACLLGCLDAGRALFLGVAASHEQRGYRKEYCCVYSHNGWL